MNFDFEALYPHHDLLVELAAVELAMDRLSGRSDSSSDSECTAQRPADLESRMTSLREALDRLPT